MPRPSLQTYSPRTLRSRARKTRQRALLAGGVTLALVLVAGYAGARVLGSETRQPARQEPAKVVRSAEQTAPATPVVNTPPPKPAPEPSGPATITVAGVGDMLFDRKVKQLIVAQGGQAPLAPVASRLAAADVTVGNLETTLADGGERIATKEPKYAFRGDPRGIESLKLAGFDAVSLANNHMLDYGPGPLEQTIASLDAAGIGHSGAGANSEDAWKPATIETESGAKVAFLAYTHILPAGFLASSERAGVASGKMDLSLIDEAIRNAKKTHDYVIVSFHWGVEYEDYANADQVGKAHRAIDAGADMVLAHHPHVIQGVEFYKDRLIAYSLGDFVFDHYSRKTGESFILEAKLGPHGVTDVEAVPVYLDEYGRPEFVKGEEARVILQRLKKISAPHGASVLVDGDIARIRP